MSLKCCRLWQGVVPFSEYKNNIANIYHPWPWVQKHVSYYKLNIVLGMGDCHDDPESEIT